MIGWSDLLPSFNPDCGGFLIFVPGQPLRFRPGIPIIRRVTLKGIGPSGVRLAWDQDVKRERGGNTDAERAPTWWMSLPFWYFFPKLVTLLCIRHTVYQYYTQLPVLAIQVLSATFRSKSSLLGSSVVWNLALSEESRTYTLHQE